MGVERPNPSAHLAPIDSARAMDFMLPKLFKFSTACRIREKRKRKEKHSLDELIEKCRPPVHPRL
jgi:hypothetical protein